MHSTTEHAAPSHPPRMLIADDDPGIIKMLASVCAAIGFDVDTATNGIHALVKAKRRFPELLIIDVNMPGADGLSVCARLLEAPNPPLNIVVVTGSRQTEIANRSDGFGAFYVRKGPEFWTELTAALGTLYPAFADRLAGLERQVAGPERRERPRVLLIDHDPDVTMFLASRLSKAGVDLLSARDVVQGHRIACKEAPSAIVCDFSFANDNVRQLIARLRIEPRTWNVPVFVLTAEVIDDITDRALSQEVCGRPGAAGIFRKTFDTAELFGALQTVCGFEAMADEPHK